MVGEIMEMKIKHLELIQSVISRMATNSFALKGWAVTLVAGIFVLAGKETDKLYFLVAYIPIVVFWFLDSYYLQQERLYRSLYDKVRVKKEGEIDFSMAASFKKNSCVKNSYINCFISHTELGFYLPLALLVAGIILVTHI